jgi:hypothetical protein
MDIPETVQDLLTEGFDQRKLRGAGFTVPDATITQRNVAALMAESSSKMRVSDAIKGNAA